MTLLEKLILQFDNELVRHRYEVTQGIALQKQSSKKEVRQNFNHLKSFALYEMVVHSLLFNIEMKIKFRFSQS